MVISPEISASKAVSAQQYEHFFSNEFHSHALLHKKPIMVEVILCNIDQCQELGVQSEKNIRNPRTTWKVAIGMDEQRQIRFAHTIPEVIALQMQMVDSEEWIDTKRRVALQYLTKIGKLEALGEK